MACADPKERTMSHDTARTTTVRSAVATVESVSLMPSLARIDVKPANSAEANANAIHISFPSLV